MAGIILLVTLSVFVFHIEAITLRNNGYEDVVIYIADNVPESAISTDKIEEWLTEASSKLYDASRYNVYLRNITIRIPSSWKRKNFYQSVSGFGGASSDIIIDEPNPLVGNTPYTFGQTICGKSAQYIHFTPELINQGNTGNFGNLGFDYTQSIVNVDLVRVFIKDRIVFTHEWGHLRWGLFDEYPSVKDHYGNPIEYYLHNGKWEPVRCSLEITGENKKRHSSQNCRLDSTGKPERDCRFFPHRDNRATAKGSIMSHSFVPSVHQFCDSKGDSSSALHNNLAPNLQNFRCGGKSAWDVMRTHLDFKDTTPGLPNKDTSPSFSYIQPNGIDKICLVIDVSGSMSSMIALARNAAISLIKLIIPDGSYVSIVQFSNNAVMLKNLTKITSEKVRDELVDALPTIVRGSTSIGAGLRVALNEFIRHNPSTIGNIIYLTSDGGENAHPYIRDVLPDILNSGVIVHTLALGRLADKQLGEISRATSGSGYFFSTDSQNSTGLVDALAQPFVDKPGNKIVKIQSKHISSHNDQAYNDTFAVDSSIGNDTVIQYSSRMLRNVTLHVTDPSGKTYTEIGKNNQQGVIAVKLPGTAEVGKYTISVSSPSGKVDGTLGVQSKPSTSEKDVIKIKAWMATSNISFSVDMKFPVYVSVLKGHMPISNAEVTVDIENGNGDSKSLKLSDNGVGADIIENDGVYSGYIISTLIHLNGRHSTKVLVQGYNATVSEPVSKSAGIEDIVVDVKPMVLPRFERTTLSEEFTIEDYVAPTSPDKDQIPPSAIQSLSLIHADNEQNKFTLSWRAVGDDLDAGTASYYDIRISKEYASLNDKTDEQKMVTNNLVPKLSGMVENFIIEPLREENVTYYVAIRAVDESNNTGDLSNIVLISILTDLTWDKPNDGPGVPIILDNSKINVVVIGAIAAVMVVAFIVIIGVFLNAFFRRRNDNKLKEKLSV